MATEEPKMVMVRVTHVIDPHNFHAQIGTEEYFKMLHEHEERLDAWGDEQSAKHANLGLTSTTQLGDLVLAYSSNWGKWVRGQINMMDLGAGEVDINCVDYGTTEIVSTTRTISKVNEMVTYWSPQAYPCSLVGVIPIAKNWISRATSFFEDLVMTDTPIAGQVIEYDQQNQVMLDLLLEDDDHNITSASDILFKEGLAKLVSVQPSGEQGKVPDFDVKQLSAKPSPPRPQAEQERDENGEDDIEKNVFRSLIGADDHGSKWVPSDQMIGAENYQPNVDENTIMTLQDDLRLMAESKEDPIAVTNDNSWGRWDRGARNQKNYPPSRGRGLRKRNPDESRSKGDTGWPPVDRSPSKPKVPAENGYHEKTMNSGAERESAYTRLQDGLFKRPAPIKDKRPVYTDDRDSNSEHRRSNTPPRDSARSNSRTGRRRDRDPYEGSRSHSSHSDSGNWSDGGRPENHRRPHSGRRDGQRRYGPQSTSQRSSKEYVQNEYTWHSSRVQRKGRAILKDLSQDTFEDTVHSFKNLIYPEESGLQNLPGPKELQLCIQLMFDYVVDNPHNMTLIVSLIDQFKDDEALTPALGEILPQLVAEFITVTTNVVVQRQRRPFLQTLGHLYVRSCDWQIPAGEPIVHCVTNCFDKWCEFNAHKQHPSPHHIHTVYIESLSTLLQVVGPTLEKQWPAKVKAGFEFLNYKCIDANTDQSVRLQIMDVLVQRVAGWPGAESSRIPKSTNVQVKDQSTQLYPYELSGCEDCGTMTEDSGPAAHYSVGTKSRSTSPQDPYRRVTHMLEELRITSLLSTFRENAIRDTLLDMQFSDLRELLREVGVKPGYIWEIKNYLDSNRDMRWSPDHRSSSRNSSDSKRDARWSPDQRSSPRSNDTPSDLSDPEVENYSEDEYSDNDYPEANGVDDQYDSKTENSDRGPLFIPPHRFSLLTPSNFTAKNYAPPEDVNPGYVEHQMPPPPMYNENQANFHRHPMYPQPRYPISEKPVRSRTDEDNVENQTDFHRQPMYPQPRYPNSEKPVRSRTDEDNVENQANFHRQPMYPQPRYPISEKPVRSRTDEDNVENQADFHGQPMYPQPRYPNAEKQARSRADEDNNWRRTKKRP